MGKWQPDIYDGNDIVRFTLGYKGKNVIFILCANPSKADDKIADKTSLQVQNIAKNNGINGWIILNLYPLRVTLPSNLPHIRNNKLHSQNISKIKKILEDYDNPIIWAAWGNIILMRDYLTECLNDIYQITEEHHPTWKCTGITKEDNPRHPSRLPNDVPLENFDIKNYLTKVI